MAKAKIGEIVDETLKNVKDSANAVIEDPKKLQSTFANNRKTISASLGAVIIVAGGAWLFAVQQATVIAKDMVDGFIDQYNLRDKVSYDNVSASPFGSVTVTGVKAHISPSTSIKVADLNISISDNNQSMTLSAESFELPLSALARDQDMPPVIYELIGMGYTTLISDLTTAVRFDDGKKTLVLETSADIRDVGDSELQITLGNVNLTGLHSLNSLSQMTGQGNSSIEESMLLGLVSSGKIASDLAELTLSEAKLTVNNSAYHKRSKEVTGLDMPRDDTDQGTRSEMPGSENALVRAGMTPSDAKAAHAAMSSWLRDGGSLQITTSLDRPLPLLRSGFDDPARLLAATKSKISN
jgi:hypothetical protein